MKKLIVIYDEQEKDEGRDSYIKGIKKQIPDAIISPVGDMVEGAYDKCLVLKPMDQEIYDNFSDFLKNKPEMFSKMNQIMDEVEHVENAEDSLYPSIWISDALALGKYHTGSNICVWKAFQSMAEIYGYVFHDGKKQAYYAEKAKKLKAAIEDKMTVMVDGKRQYLEGIGGIEESQKRWISDLRPHRFHGLPVGSRGSRFHFLYNPGFPAVFY